jgi:hypothetical protein
MPEDDDAQERHINIHFAPEMMAGAYANFANVSHSDYASSCPASISPRSSCGS